MRLTKGRYIISIALALIIMTVAAYAMSQNNISYVEKFETDRVNIELKAFSVTKTGKHAAATGIVEANKDISYIPRITNRDAPCYIRAKVNIDIDDDSSETLDTDCLYGLSENWVRKGEYLYCTELMETGACADIFKGIHIPENWESAGAEKMKIAVKAEAVQGKNFTPDFSAVLPWGAVRLDAVAKAQDMDVIEAVTVQDISELKFDSEVGFQCGTSDLFDDFSGMMPGDCFEKTVILENKSSNTLQTYLSISSGGKKLGEALQLKVTCENIRIYEGTLADAVNTDKIKMIKLPKGEKNEITVTLTLPANTESEYEALDDCLIWELYTEKMPETSAQTSDWNSRLPLAVMIILSGLLMIYAVGFRKRGTL